MLRKKIIYIIMLGMVLILAQDAYALKGDTIYLHNGSSIIGEIIESVPGISFTLRRQDGTTRVFKMEEVWKVKFEGEEISEDRFYLKDGGVIIGRIIGAIPGETYSIRSADKSILVFRMDEVERVEIGKKIYAPSPTEQPQLPVLPQPPVTLKHEPARQKEGLAGQIGVGLNYPGVDLKIGLTPRFLLEARGQFGEGISAYGLRGYYYFNPKGKPRYFTGMEADLINFKGEESKGNGWCAIGFLGGEYFLSERFSLQLDFGPVYVSIKDKNTNLSEGGIDYLVNMGINLYFKQGVR